MNGKGVAVAAVPRESARERACGSREDGVPAAALAVHPDFALIGGASGVLAGVLELAYATAVGPGAHMGSRVLLLAVTCSLLGFCGYLYGGALHLLNAAASSRALPWAPRLLVACAAGAAAARYHPLNAAVIGVAALAGLSWVGWRPSRRGVAVLLVWGALLYVLSPLFNGHAMDRVFTDAQADVIFVAVVAVLPVLAFALIVAPVAAGAAAPAPAMLRPAVVQAAGAILIAAALTACSSVFLIRLWGFHTMVYLQVTLLVLKIGCLTTALTAVRACWPATGWRRPRRETNLLVLLALLLLFVLSAYAGMRRDPHARVLLAQLPDTSLLATTIGDVLDHDRDGYSAIFGFGDCDDANPDIAPGAIDWPGDGIDENCFAGDLQSVDHPYFNRLIAVDPPARRDPAPARRQVVVLVLIDALRADAVDYSGNPAGATPAIAGIARRAVRFDRAYAQSNNTLESMPFMTHLGFRSLPRFEARLTLPSQFKAGGVASAGVFEAPQGFWFNELDSVFMGFDEQFVPDAHTGYRTPEATAALALEQVRGHRGAAPLFLYVHFQSVHDSFTQVMEGDRLRGSGVNLSEIVRLWNIQEMVTRMKHRYLTAATRVDQAVGMLFDGLRQVETDTDVLFIITADHGEEFYDHGGLFHMGTLHEELVRVPLIVYRTGGTPRAEAAPVGLYAVPATILKWFGYQGDFLDDMDLLRVPVLAQQIFGYFSFAGEWQRRTFMIVEDGYKLIHDAGRGRLELFDLGGDPHERRNLAGEPPYRDVEQRLARKMDTTMFYLHYGDIEYARRMQAQTASVQ